MDRLESTLRWCNEREKLKRTTWVYFIKCGQFVKIGIAAHVPSRIALLQIGNPHKLTLLGAFKSQQPVKDEEAIHCQLARYRVRGEWFELPETVLSALLAEFLVEHPG